MKRTAWTILGLLCMLAAAISPAQADTMRRTPGSILVYPVYLSGGGNQTLISITNTHDEPGFQPSSNLDGVVNVHFVYVDGRSWKYSNRFESLTPNDTLTVTADFHSPNSPSGFLYCIAWNPSNGAAADLDYLVGDELVIDAGGNFLYAVEAIAFSALTNNGEATDLDGDGRTDLDGIEYEAPGDEQIISSFIGQGLQISSTLILISLVESSDYLTDLDLVIYNDNEQSFSSGYQFRCWAYESLANVSGVFNHAFLLTTNVDPNSQGLPITTGWARLDGDRAVDTTGNEPPINDPPFIGALVQSWNGIATGHLLHQTPADNPTGGSFKK